MGPENRSGRPEQTPVRTFGPTWFTVATGQGDIGLEQTLLCSEGDPLGGDLVFNRTYPQIFGPGTDFLLETLADTKAEGHCSDAGHPVLSLKSALQLAAGESCDLWFRVDATGEVTVETSFGEVTGSGRLQW